MDNTSKKEFRKFLDLKVYTNKKNGQSIIMLPKKKIGQPAPKKVRIIW